MPILINIESTNAINTIIYAFVESSSSSMSYKDPQWSLL